MGKTTPLAKLSIGLIILLALINLLAVASPELGFDALWYHLTLPKLFLLQQRWFYPGGLLYYSAMPRLAETLFIPLLAVFGTVGPKLLQFISGLLVTYITFLIARRYHDLTKASFAALLFYATWLVSWQSGSAYVDLIRTVFESLALLTVLNKRYLLSGIFLGLAIGVKLHALATLIIFAIIFSPWILPSAILISLPWFLIAFHYTKNPFYPLFEKFMHSTQLAQVGSDYFNLLSVLKRLVLIPHYLSFPFDDMLNPLLGLLFVLAVYQLLSHLKHQRRLLAISLMGLIIWQLTPPPSSRYLLPYLPAICVISINALSIKRLNKLLTVLIFTSAILIIIARSYANSKYMPYLLRRQSTQEFLASYSHKLPGTLIDSDQWIKDNLSSDSSILIDQWHNLYYFPHNFNHISWVYTSKKYDYLVTQKQDPKLIPGKLVHTNSLGVQIFKLK